MLIRHENLKIESSISISHVLKLEMEHSLNEHGSLTLEVTIKPEEQEVFSRTSYVEQNIKFFVYHEGEDVLFFSGKISKVLQVVQDQLFKAVIHLSSYSVDMDVALHSRSFQNISLRYGDVINRVIEEDNARFIWRMESDRTINKPFIQYQETNWQFIKRLATYFECPIQASVLSERPDFYFGIREGRLQRLREEWIVERGVSNAYYESGAYEKGMLANAFCYVISEQRSSWQIGDFIQRNNQRLVLVHQKVMFEQGELIFMNTFGAEGFLYRRKAGVGSLAGLSLQGMIRKVEKESVYIQLNIDEVEGADFPWGWVPEVGNTAYIMPEVGSRVVLTLPTNDEKDGIATQLLRTNVMGEVFQPVEFKQMVTAHDKTLSLNPNQLLLAGRNRDVNISMEDQLGIHSRSNRRINLVARGQIVIKGSKVNITAPNSVLLQTAVSNIGIAGNFNLFAPGGVQTSIASSFGPPMSRPATKTGSERVLPLSYFALGAIPKRHGQSLRDATIANMATAAMPKMAGGKTTWAMHAMMTGQRTGGKAPQVISGLGSLTSKGGKLLPN
ncbi:MAG: phage late control D family protein [Lachnospiraceae bacterium]|nr:phage late control D family protein [Lachnospiraceae bacterium]